MNISYKNVTIDVRNKNKAKSSKYARLVENCCGEIKSGELLALMGPSGCGKTTLLSALAGRFQKGSITSGSILVNNEVRNAQTWLKTIGFVDQDDQIFELLSVKETLEYAARFRLKNASKSIIKEKINILCQNFGLTNVIKNQMSKLSGGERKRVMIAVELITDPEVIFLDEPTSGLDTKTALNIIKLLKDLAQKGKTIVITIHQPSIEIYNMFDKLLLMSKGKTIYSGPANACEEFLFDKGIEKREGISFPDFIAEMAVTDSIFVESNTNIKKVEEIMEEFDRNNINTNYIVTKKNENFYNFSIKLNDVFYLFKRKFISKKRNFWKFVKPIIGRSFFVTFIATNFYFIKNAAENAMNERKQNAAFLFVDESQSNIIDILMILSTKILLSSILLPMLLITCIVFTLPSFFDEDKVIKREIAVGSYSAASYYLGTFLYCFVNEFIFSITILVSLLLISRKHLDVCFYIYILLNPILGIFIGLAYGSISRNKKVINIFGGIFTFLTFINHVTLVNFKSITSEYFSPNVYKFVKLLFYIAIIIPSLHWYALFLSYHSEKLEDLISENPYFDMNLHFGRKSNVYFTCATTYIGDLTLKKYAIVILLVANIILYAAFAIYRQTVMLMPEIRMKLSKNN
ncbi:hypothetical protein COBT_001989 [Conglomerata obtusa]